MPVIASYLGNLLRLHSICSVILGVFSKKLFDIFGFDPSDLFVFRVKNGRDLPLVVSSPPNAIIMRLGLGGLGYLNLKWIWCHV